jgi:hypothetical protein
MPNWREILDELGKAGSAHDTVRRKYLAELHTLTGRNVITYYSGWLQDATAPDLVINDHDKNGFMAAINGLDCALGLDLILHTPGGDVAATESLVDYLHQKFQHIRVIVPQIAMSAGTMIACASNEILMGKQSSLGPIDPLYNGLPAHGVIEEFQNARQEIFADQRNIYLWQPIIAKYNPTLIGECQKSINWANQIVEQWLKARMFAGDANAATTVQTILDEIGSHALTFSHARHLSAQKCQGLGLKVSLMEADQALQDAVLTVHHAAMHTLGATPACKIIENHLGVAFIRGTQRVMVRQ